MKKLSPEQGMPCLFQVLDERYGRPGEAGREAFERATFQFIQKRAFERNRNWLDQIRKKGVQSFRGKNFNDRLFKDFQASLHEASKDINWLTGKMGITRSHLHAQGEVLIYNKLYSAISRSGYIKKGVPIIVIGNYWKDLIVIKASENFFTEHN